MQNLQALLSLHHYIYPLRNSYIKPSTFSSINSNSQTSRFTPIIFQNISRSMNISTSIHASSQPPTNSSFAIQVLDSSIETLINSWHRRRKWLQLLFITTQYQNFSPNWRTRLANFLESTWVHVFSIFLLIVDLLITILELSSSLLSCDESQYQNRTEEKAELGFLFHWVGIGILCFLSAKSLALLVGLGWSFFKHGGYVIDGFVAIGALVLEAFLEKIGGGLIVVVMLWRVVRVVESAFELSDEAIEAQIEAIVCQFVAVRDENRRLLETIQKLQEDLDQCCCQSKANILKLETRI